MKIRKTLIYLIALFTLLLFTGCGSAKGDLAGGQQDASDAVKDSPSDDVVLAEDKSGDLIPDGVLVNTDNQLSLTYLDTNGQVITEIQTPGIGTAEPDNVAITGPVIPGQPFPPVIYHSWEPGQGLMANTNGQVATLRQTNYLLSLIGAPGQSALIFSEVQIDADNFPHSFLYSGNPENLGTVGSFYDLVDAPNYWALKPVGIKTISGQAQAVWYTKTAWGIGGADLIFPITKELSLFDLTNGDNLQYLSTNRSFQGISPDLTYAGSIDMDASGNRAMTVINLSNNQQTTFSLDPNSDRGAGWVVFSPDNRFAAWLEANGSIISDPYDFDPRVRVGEIQTGGVIGALEATAAAQVINGDQVTFMRPAGWLDTKTLLVEVRGENWGDVTLLRFDITTGGISVFASGSFVSFGYK
ncbi:MAG: hypothetical protein Q7J07_00230 [Pelolinea sp.]|nr:hypothetical protein [Pelolinea sp.]